MKKVAARSRSPASRPGAVSVKEDKAAQLDQRIVDKQREAAACGATSAETGALPLGLGKLQHDVALKQQGRSSSSIVSQIGAFPSASYASSSTSAASGLSILDADVAAKQRGRPSERRVDRMHQKLAAKVSGNNNNKNNNSDDDNSHTKSAAHGSACGAASGATAAEGGAPSRGLGQLQHDVALKQQGRSSSSIVSKPGAFSSAYAASSTSAASGLSTLDADVAAKQRGRPSEQRVDSMDQKLAAKVSGNNNNKNNNSDDDNSHTKSAAHGSACGAASGATAAEAGASSRGLSQLQHDVALKQQGRSSSSIVSKPGAFSSASYAASSTSAASGLSTLDADVAAKQRGRPSEQRVDSMNQKIAAKVRGNSNNDSHKKPTFQVDVLEEAKIKSNDNNSNSRRGAAAAAAGMTSPGVRATLTSLKDEAASKQGAIKSVGGGRTHKELTRLDDRILAKNNQQDAAAAAGAGAGAAASASAGAAPSTEFVTQTATPPTLRETEDTALKKNRGAATGADPNMLTKRDDDSSGIAGTVQRFKNDDAINGLTANPSEASAGRGGDGGLGGGNADVEYGEYGGPEEQGLAVAFAVEDESEDMFIPSAVEYDPDAKPPMYRNRRFRLYAMLAIVVVVIATIGTTVGITLSQDEGPPEVSFRETIGIRENVERLVGIEVLEEPTSPYRKAFQWIMHEDERQMEPDHPQFSQRYLAGYFYFATSQKRRWASCGKAQEGEIENCIYKKAPHEFPSKRWLSAGSECTWAGVRCDETGHFSSLEFSANNMTGTFPSGIAGFPFLQSLTLSVGELEGPLPENIAEMKHLIKIDLAGNLLTGTIPDMWYESRSLQHVILKKNKIGGQVSKNVGKLKDIINLDIGDNMFKGSLPDEIGQLSSSRLLFLENNRFNGTIPTTIGTLATTTGISLQHNEISGTIPTEIGLMAELVDFLVHVNRMQGSIPEEFYDANKMYRLDLSANKFTGTISTRIGEFVSIRNLRVNDNEFSGVLPSQMGQFLGLKEFQGFGNAFTGTVPHELCDAIVPSVLDDLVLDCAKPVIGVPEIECSCCTSCCNSDGEFCAPRQ